MKQCILMCTKDRIFVGIFYIHRIEWTGFESYSIDLMFLHGFMWGKYSGNPERLKEWN